MTGKSEVKGIDNCGFRDNSCIGIVGGGVDLVIAGKGVSGSEFSTWENLPNNVEVL